MSLSALQASMPAVRTRKWIAQILLVAGIVGFGYFAVATQGTAGPEPRGENPFLQL